jgi:hypothetical protein
MGQAALAMWWDMAPAVRHEFEHWHSHEHFPERLALPGFLRASRWSAEKGEGFFVLYELAVYEALVSREYLARLNAPTEWSRRMMPHHRNMVRSQCRVLGSRGTAVAGHAITVRLSPLDGQERSLQSYLETLVRRLPGEPGLAGAHLLQTDSPALTPTTEQRIRGLADQAADWILLVTGYERAALHALARAELAPASLKQSGSKPGALLGSYSLRLSAVTAQRAASAQS